LYNKPNVAHPAKRLMRNPLGYIVGIGANQKMKNNIKKFWIPITVGLLMLLVLACMASCLVAILIPENPIKLASSMSRVELPKGTTIVTNNDTGPGLPIPGGASDGYTFLVLQIPPEKVVEFTTTLKKSPFWKPLPLSAELAEHEEYIQPSFMGGVEETIPIATSTGYYLFIDSQEEYNKSSGKQVYEVATPFYERYSYNFTFCLFNDKDGKLYLWRIDT
jgi:hypothetical protein